MIQLRFVTLFLLFNSLLYLSHSDYAYALGQVPTEKMVTEFATCDLSKKRIILKALTRLDKKNLFPFFKNLVSHEDEYIRLYAFEAISNFKTDEAFLLLSKALTDSSKLVIEGSIPLFAKFNSPNSLRLMEFQLKNGDLSVKKRAIKTLGYIGTINTINQLEPFMSESEPSLRLDAVKAASLIMKRGGIFFTVDIDADFDLARKTNGLNSAEKLNSSLIPIIKKVVTDPNVASKDKAEFLTSLSLLAKTYLDKLNTYTMFEEDERLISRAKNIQAIILSMMPDLIKSFGSQDDLVRWSIVKLFKEYQDKAAIPVFRAGLRDSFYPVRVSSIEGLVLLNHLESLEEILALLKDDVNIVRVAAIQAAISFKATDKHEAFIPLVSEYDNQIKWSATKALGALSDTKAINYLKSVAKSEESFLRVVAINSLGDLPSEGGLETVIAALKDSSPLVREAAATALTHFENIEITHKNLLELITDQNSHVRLAVLKSMDFMIRGNVSEPGRKALVSAITKLSTDEDQQIRTKSEEILKGLNISLRVKQSQ